MEYFKLIKKYRCVFDIVTSSSGFIIHTSGVFVFFIRHLRLNRPCLLFFFLLYGVITCQNAFSRGDWQKSNLVIDYNRIEKSITFECVVYEYIFKSNQHAFLNRGEFAYSTDGTTYIHLMQAAASYEKETDQVKINMKFKKKSEVMQIINPEKLEYATLWPEGENIIIKANMIYSQYLDGLLWSPTKMSYIIVKWFLPPACKGVKTIKLKGVWIIDGGQRELFNVVYMLNIVKSKANTINGPSVLQSDIANQVKLTRDADAITVTGAKPGENIKVYTVSGVEVKSVVANEDVVNIKLPTNQIYIVKAGQAAYKFAL